MIAGEASGDLHAANLMQALKLADEAADFRYFGGDRMQAVGGTLLLHYREMAYMGFVPVLMHLPAVVRNLRLCKRAIEAYQPDAVVLVDYAGFNLRIAKFVKQRAAARTIYYISPKIWAWKEGRVRTIRRVVDRMLCILPFEVDFYKKHRYEVAYVGNPTVDAVAGRERAAESFEEFTQAQELDKRPIIALLAGSRKQEIKDNLPAMLEASAPFEAFQRVIAGAPGIEPAYYEHFITKKKNVRVVFGQTYRLLQQSQAALVTSGTATLETALLHIPQAVCYKLPLPKLSSFVFKKFFSCPYISLVNLIAGKNVVKELFGKDFSVENIREELDRLLYNKKEKEKMEAGYREMGERLGGTGASQRAATEIVSYLTQF